MNIDIVNLIDMLYSHNYTILIKSIGVYMSNIDDDDLKNLYEDIVWSYILNNMLVCRNNIISFIKTLHNLQILSK